MLAIGTSKGGYYSLCSIDLSTKMYTEMVVRPSDPGQWFLDVTRRFRQCRVLVLTTQESCKDLMGSVQFCRGAVDQGVQYFFSAHDSLITKRARDLANSKAICSPTTPESYKDQEWFKSKFGILEIMIPLVEEWKYLPAEYYLRQYYKEK